MKNSAYNTSASWLWGKDGAPKPLGRGFSNRPAIVWLGRPIYCRNCRTTGRPIRIQLQQYADCRVLSRMLEYFFCRPTVSKMQRRSHHMPVTLRFFLW